MKNRQVTMKDIAKRMGVSSVTISKALNDKDGVSEELKAEIKRVSIEMGYRINTLAKSMKEGYSYNIGILIPERFTGDLQSFYMKFYNQVSKVLENYNYYAILEILDKKDEEELNFPRIYSENKVDGIIVLGQLNNDYIEMFQNIDIPNVFLDFYTDNSQFDSIVTDNFYGVYELTNYLIKLGHTNIGFVGNIHSTSSIQDRYLGYYKSLLEHNIPLKDSYIFKDRDDYGKYLDIELTGDLPTAFVCNCDQVAYNLIRRLNSLGYNVPNDFSVVGFDDDIYASLTTPPLTTVAVDVKEMSSVAVKIIIKKIKDKTAKYGRILIKGNVIYRESVNRIDCYSKS
ncbi:LacI family transcriptional regulator [Natronobacillus azotifigens]|uniref:Substrate-binding domain-containing protein n=1 Tax=Natronobacillus azotifigens TaxID=472978 RepID=A0A9J6RBN5_9BACI|nr:substrate-binding domain-containing protein [Natronobacillus azotifigens]MCZ0703096.1 substrate-binding domain-containing protein [Natronobacillus azotifigens]